MRDLRALFYRKWFCHMWIPCRPEAPQKGHQGESCGWRWMTMPMDDETAAEYGIVYVDPKLEALAEALWAYYGDSDSDSWEGTDQNERDEYIHDARQLFDDIKEAMK